MAESPPIRKRNSTSDASSASATTTAASFSAPSHWNVANLITGLRIALVPVLVVLLLDPTPTRSVLAGATFFVACWSDFFDGYLARAHGLATDMGKFLDPMADKLIVVSALIMLATALREPRVPGWLVALIVGRELAITGLRTIALERGIVLAADELGKYKTILQMFALHGLLIHYTFAGIDFHAAGMLFLWMSLVLGLWSALRYQSRVFRGLSSP